MNGFHSYTLRVTETKCFIVVLFFYFIFSGLQSKVQGEVCRDDSGNLFDRSTLSPSPSTTPTPTPITTTAPLVATGEQRLVSDPLIKPHSFTRAV